MVGLSQYSLLGKQSSLGQVGCDFSADSKGRQTSEKNNEENMYLNPMYLLDLLMTLKGREGVNYKKIPSCVQWPFTVSFLPAVCPFCSLVGSPFSHFGFIPLFQHSGSPLFQLLRTSLCVGALCSVPSAWSCFPQLPTEHPSFPAKPLFIPKRIIFIHGWDGSPGAQW